MSAYYIGIDIGSTAAKTVVLSGDAVAEAFTLPTGWSGKETAGTIRRTLEEKGYLTGDHRCTATGYGRVCVDWADRVVTEITCHGKGGWALFGRDCTIIDVGGQDTKVITVAGAQVKDFLMNDKCAAGTGKFIEVMASRLGAPLAISAMCTVFAESEVISHIGAGERREDIAAGIVHSVAGRVARLCERHGITGDVALTGGLCDSRYFIATLSGELGRPVASHPFARYAGALGAAIAAAGKDFAGVREFSL